MLKDLDKRIKWALVGLGGLIILLLAFQFGMFVGFHKARFSYAWGDNYHRNFGGPQGGFLRDFSGKDFINGHGITGTVAKVETNTLVIKAQDGAEKTVNVTDQTTIRQGSQTIKISDLKPDERVVIIGTPKDDGTITAEIIRLFDAASMPMPQGLPGFHFLWFR
ncbi:MAG TPA: hypothetical protein VL306_01640 [Methylomirabilota bacterium]|jgi:hypothetical protein|nr:hypothetical protein [Methylomirabilota bacterium]